MGAENGPLGCPTGPEQDVPGQRGRRQTFQRGEMAWSPDQGEDLIVTAYRLWNDAVLEWSATSPHYHYKYFRIGITFNGVDLALPDAKVMREPDRGRIWTKLQGYGEYAFKVKGCDDGDDDCKQGYTIPVRVQLGPYTETLNPCDRPVGGLIAERWNELGAWDGPLGCPTADEVSSGNKRTQLFQHGQISTSPQFGSEMVVAAYQQGRSIVVNWGLAQDPSGLIHKAYRVDVYFNGFKRFDAIVESDPFDVLAGLDPFEWARPNRSGQYRFSQTGDGLPLNDGLYEFLVHPMLQGTEFFIEEATEPVTVFFQRGSADAHLAPPTERSPAQAFVRHDARAKALMEHMAGTRLLTLGYQETGEDLSITLIARLQALQSDPNHRNPGELPSRILVNEVLKDVSPGPVGTDTQGRIEVWGPITCEWVHGEYDTFLKGLIAIAYRYRNQLFPQVYDHVVHDLLTLRFGHDIGIESKEICGFDAPESENHILLIETARYLTNQLLFEQTNESRYDNNLNGLGDWLLDYLHTIARHDFLEYNARPYQRYSLNALLNLQEFASEFRINTAAQILLDYITVKFALSSNMLRRVGPFRRLKERVNKVNAETNDLFSGKTDPLTGFFLMYVGPADKDGKPGEWFPDVWSEEGLIVGLAPYRPPAAAYVLALTRHEPVQHRFYHGQRPTVRRGEPAGGGVEIYYSSPSFLLTAGGMFLNSGYGHDEFTGYAQTGAVQAITLLPTRGDLKFEDLIRFDLYPNDRQANNTGVHYGFACGANLRIPDKWLNLTHTSKDGPWFLLNLDTPECGSLGLYVAAYRTPVADPDHLITVPDNLGCLYAVESSMSFADFSRIPELNSLPAKLEYGGRYVLNTPDQHSFNFGLWPDGFPYQTRIVVMDGNPLEVDLTKLPLAEGPYLSSRGHEGYFQIRHPGCITPLVLDFRNPRAPIRIDNDAACPQWLLDLAAALHEYAWQLWHAGRHADGVAAARDRVKVYERLAQIDAATYRPILAQALVDLCAFRRVEDIPAPEQAGQRAVELFQELAGITDYQNLSQLTPNPHWHPGLSSALATLAWAQWDAMHKAEAVSSLQNRVKVYERLAQIDAATYRPILAQALVDLCAFRRVEDIPAPEQAGQRAVELFQELAGITDYQNLSQLTPNPHWHPGLSSALATLAWAQWDAMHKAEAVSSLQNRVKVYERLAQIDAATYRPILAQALVDLAAFQ
jgi:LGFP repeat